MANNDKSVEINHGGYCIPITIIPTADSLKYGKLNL